MGYRVGVKRSFPVEIGEFSKLRKDLFVVLEHSYKSLSKVVYVVLVGTRQLCLSLKGGSSAVQGHEVPVGADEHKDDRVQISQTGPK